MNCRRAAWFAIPLFLLSIRAPAQAQQVEEASADSVPWSGWWWPAVKGHLVLGYREEPGALVKHDFITGRHAVSWEQQAIYHFDPQGEIWWGHCHAWAAASLLEPEPRRDVAQGLVIFHVGDIKGLLTEAHYNDHAAFYGQRFNGLPGDDFQDMAPSLVWSVLRKYIHDNHVGLVFDLDPGVAVDSHPVYRYRVTTQPAADGQWEGKITIWYAIYQVNPDYLGTDVEQRDYTFTFQMQNGQMVTGTDHWIEASLMDHPDFAWYPIERAQGNPELDYDLVTQLDAAAQ